MSSFFQALRACQPKNTKGRRWLFVPYDQLHDGIGPLATEPTAQLGIVLVESSAKAGRRPYHQQKLAMVLANMRHFALEQAARGVAVRYLTTADDCATALGLVVQELGPLRVQRPAERELRAELKPLLDAGGLVEIPHEGWLTDRSDFEAIAGPPWRMDAFYRQVRRRSGVLMERGKPVGGKFSFDAENRKPWRGDPPPPVPPRFQVDAITAEVGELVQRRFGHHPGQLQLDQLPATVQDAERQWQWALSQCLPQFGPFEDAFSVRSSGLFHTRIAPLLNMHRLLPKRVLDEVLATRLPLASKEGFIRQILGWREFVRHVHEATDGFRAIGGEPLDANHLKAQKPLPPAFWGKRSGLHCLDHVVEDVWREGYSHHITRLMVLGNLATLMDVDPRALTDWFWVAYTDAYDWVVEPNVLAMASFAVGELMTTKPYVAGSAYLHRMGDACGDCAFDPKSTCPITRLYWQFLTRNKDRLAGNQRLAMPLKTATKRREGDQKIDAATLHWVQETLAEGKLLRPQDAPAATAALDRGS